MMKQPTPGNWLGLAVGLAVSTIGFSAENPAGTGIASESTDPAALARERLFRQVFHQAPPRIPINSYVLLVIDGVESAKVRVAPGPTAEDILLEGKAVVALLARYVRPDTVQQLQAAIDEHGWLAPGALRGTGLTVDFDLRKFQCTIAVPPAKRATVVQELNRPPAPVSTREPVTPAPVSGFVNLNLKGTLRRDSAAAASGSRAGLAFVSDGAINVRGVVLEGSAAGQIGQDAHIQRGDVRLVYDVPPRALRFTFGDLDYPSFGYAHRVDMLGLGVAKDFSLQPYVSTYRSGEFEFYLDQPAEVKMFVNDSLVKTQSLAAGAHDIRGLVPAIGQNDMQLVIEDAAGRRQVLRFSFIFDPILLEKGRSVYAYDVGFRREIAGGNYRYDFSLPMVSASCLRGFSDVTTAGGHVQADRSRALVGTRVLRVVPPGTLRIDVAGSRSDGLRPGAATTVELTSRPNAVGVQWQGAAEYLSARFDSTSRSSAPISTALSLRASLAWRLNRKTTLQLSQSYAFVRAAGRHDGHFVAATLVERLNRYVTGSVSLRNRRPSGDRSITEFLVGFSVSFTRGHDIFYATKELESNTITTQWDAERPSNRNTPYGFASTRTGSGDQEYQAGAGYWSDQGIAEAYYTHDRFGGATGHTTRDEATLRLQAGLVFAGTAIGVSRPVLDNFAIVTGKEGLARVGLKVDPDGEGGSAASSHTLNPAVVGNLASYRVREINVEPIDPPLGAVPDTLSFAIAPTYKSGTHLQVGKPVSLVAMGRLVDEQGMALVHLPIEIQRLDSTEPPEATFTSRTGTFQLAQARPGRFMIRAPNAPEFGSVAIEIRATPDGLVRLGNVVLPAAR